MNGCAYTAYTVQCLLFIDIFLFWISNNKLTLLQNVKCTSRIYCVSIVTVLDACVKIHDKVILSRCKLMAVIFTAFVRSIERGYEILHFSSGECWTEKLIDWLIAVGLRKSQTFRFEWKWVIAGARCWRLMCLPLFTIVVELACILAYCLLILVFIWISHIHICLTCLSCAFAFNLCVCVSSRNWLQQPSRLNVRHFVHSISIVILWFFNIIVIQ